MADKKVAKKVSGDPRKRASQTKKTATKKSATGMGRARPRPTAVSSVDEWLAEAEGQLLELPSGKVVRAIMPGMQAFLRADLIPNELMPIVMEAVDEQKPMTREAAAELQKDPEMLMKLADSFDQIFAYCVTEPRFELPPTQEDVEVYNEKHPEEPVDGPAELRVRGTLYTDRVSMDDKSFIFHVAVGGTRDLERFRQESEAEMAAIQASLSL
jgi:hypothetical protein